MRAAVIQHVPFEGPALVESALVGAGFAVRVVRVDLGAALPGAADVDVLVVLGGPMGVDDDLAHLADERELIARCVRAGKPVLGICLGAQLPAAALGAPVTRGERPEVGAGEVVLTADDPVLGPSGAVLPVVHWHGDAFGLPAGATLLASSDRYPHQAFRVGASYGFQFHVELDAAALAGIAPHLPPDVAVTAEQARAVADEGARVLDRWAAQVLESARR
ncbi:MULTISPECIES: type 1 glutamine amidotransferase [Actinosynnema]|uniref:type 1 glutamine amidotransferase n=1 Tax=Actinosynnema TaxID=40566 RepID=UPI0020A2ED00|nr:type 1 glutamine amidotransferase [Actinosynnema pretiosum]MCP2094413.1 GMP synthase (glutamine-hydrolyzing) [Actinosynnema pretiosum]